MQVAVLVFFLAAILGQGNADVNCPLPTPVEKFAASYTTAMTVGNDPAIVNTLSLPGGQAALLFYEIGKQALDAYKYQGCDREEISFIASFPLSRIENLTLPIYFKLEARAVGAILYQYGVLDCNNAVSLSLEYFKYNREDAQEYKLDPHKFDTYFHEILFGGFKFYKAHGLKLEEVLAPTADAFSKLFNVGKTKQNCSG